MLARKVYNNDDITLFSVYQRLQNPRVIMCCSPHRFADRAATHYHTWAWQTLLHRKECFILMFVLITAHAIITKIVREQHVHKCTLPGRHLSVSHPFDYLNTHCFSLMILEYNKRIGYTVLSVSTVKHSFFATVLNMFLLILVCANNYRTEV